MMIKLASPSDWNLQGESNPLEVKISSRGFTRGDQMKVASEVGDRFIHEVRKIEDDLDKVNFKFAHVISCGATERTGCNRNGDGWSAAVLDRDMLTYLKYARCYRDHDNKETSPAYGHVKIAFYDSDRGYGRLLAAYNATDKAAKDKGQHIADLEIASLDKKADLRVSHGTTVGSDTCVHCGNVAKKRSEYCLGKDEGGDCPLFGCRNGLSKVSDDGRIQFVDNPRNKFYDISTIGLTPRTANQADRVAFLSLFDPDHDTKISSLMDGAVPGSAWIAEKLGLQLRTDLYDFDGLTFAQKRIAKVAMELAKAEEASDHRVSLRMTDASSLRDLHSKSAAVRRSAARSLMSRGELPGAYCFAKAAGLSDDQAETVEILSEDLLGKLISEGRLESLIKLSDFTRDCSLTPGVVVAAPGCQLTGENISRARRTEVFAQNSFAQKRASVSGGRPAADKQLAKIAVDYTAMKILFAAQILENDPQSLDLIANVR